LDERHITSPELLCKPEYSSRYSTANLALKQTVKRRFRLTKSNDIKRVRQLGKSYAHPLIVLIALQNQRNTSRFAVIAGRSAGNAVKRNRVKRWIREAVRPLIPDIEPGWDIVIVARRPIADANFQNSRKALLTLLNRAQLIKDPNGN
jgi:ribonuclease P protein component